MNHQTYEVRAKFRVKPQTSLSDVLRAGRLFFLRHDITPEKKPCASFGNVLMLPGRGEISLDASCNLRIHLVLRRNTTASIPDTLPHFADALGSLIEGSGTILSISENDRDGLQVLPLYVGDGPRAQRVARLGLALGQVRDELGHLVGPGGYDQLYASAELLMHDRWGFAA